MSLEVDLTSRSNKLFRDGLSPISGDDVERRATTLFLGKIDVTASSNELRCGGRMSSFGRYVKRRGTIHHLKIDVTASSNELFRDGFMLQRAVERR